PALRSRRANEPVRRRLPSAEPHGAGPRERPPRGRSVETRTPEAFVRRQATTNPTTLRLESIPDTPTFRLESIPRRPRFLPQSIPGFRRAGRRQAGARACISALEVLGERIVAERRARLGGRTLGRRLVACRAARPIPIVSRAAIGSVCGPLRLLRAPPAVFPRGE